MPEIKKINVLLADDDKDDIFFFTRAIKQTRVANTIKFVEDGEMLIDYLNDKKDDLPEILFLDINMPRKNGLECLKEIKANTLLKKIPIVIYSTSIDENVTDVFYTKGAHYYLQKCDFNQLVENLDHILSKLQKNDFKRPVKEKFIFNLQQA